MPGDDGFAAAAQPWNRAITQPVAAVVEAAALDEATLSRSRAIRRARDPRSVMRTNFPGARLTASTALRFHAASGALSYRFFFTEQDGDLREKHLPVAADIQVMHRYSPKYPNSTRTSPCLDKLMTILTL
ncbi:hypothetical protein F5X71_13710 [Nocardia brasiliensis]|uniref:Uncharacterized protein n=1 Tax=Nocardia brasiliensis TaxID=37326 RepID=A0A6G9XQN1_NOCBR|nr:hypothetical protein [Nocardia brasiliensis]QIS03227.1 hypothetical protein F5X71_13710 [Nocardia brasiliensis]